MNNIKLIKATSVWAMLGLAIVITGCDDKNSDLEIKKNVDKEIMASDISGSISSTVSKGIVTLEGNCEGNDCGTLIANKVRSVKGVDSVFNNIAMTINPDLTLRTAVLNVVSKYEGVQADVAQGVVVLRGSASKKDVKMLVEELSSLRPTKIDNQLAIK